MGNLDALAKCRERGLKGHAVHWSWQSAADAHSLSHQYGQWSGMQIALHHNRRTDFHSDRLLVGEVQCATAYTLYDSLRDASAVATVVTQPPVVVGQE